MKSYVSNDGLCKQIKKIFWFWKWKKRPFPSSKNPHFQNEAKCETFLVKMSFIRMRIKNVFTSLALYLASLWNRGLRQPRNGLLKVILHGTIRNDDF